MLEIIISALFLVAAGYLITKNYDAKVILFLVGIALLSTAVLLNHPIIFKAPDVGTGSVWLDPFKKVSDVFFMQMGIVGLTIMVLFGFASYMNHIGANDVTVHVLSKPIKHIRSVYILVPIIFLIENALSIVLPSASGLAILLMATLYPVMRSAGITPLTAAAVIATAATITPTPLGSDNVVIAQRLGMTSLEYVVKYHAKVSIPALFVIAAMHYFWQKWMDQRMKPASKEDKFDHNKLNIRQDLPPSWYAIFPILPIILLLFFNLAFIDPTTKKSTIHISLIEITIISIIIPLIIELIRHRQFKTSLKTFNLFFEGMGTGFTQVVSLVIAAGTFVEGLKAMGVIDTLTNSLNNVHGAGPILLFFFSGMASLIGFISGSGLAVFHSFIKIIPEITEQLNVNTIMVALPMQLTANLIRAVSPVSAVIIIVASVIKVSPIDIIKRTSIPIISGMITCMLLSYLFFH